MQIPMPVLSLVASASVALMYDAACTTGTSSLWLSAFAAVIAFFVRTIFNLKSKPSSIDRVRSGSRVEPVAAHALLYASFVYGLKTLGPVRSAFAAACVAGLPYISRYRRSSRIIKSVATAVCCALLIVIPDPAQTTEPSIIYGAIGVLCVALSVRLASSDALKSSSNTYAPLVSGAVLGVLGLIVTLLQKKPAAANEMAVLLIFCVGACLLISCVAGGLTINATAATLAASLTGIAAASLFCTLHVFLPFNSWESAAAFVCSLLILIEHRGRGSLDHSSLAAGGGIFNPAQLFKKSKPYSESGGIVETLMANSRERKLFIFFLLTMAIMLLEFFYGVAVNSLGLISDSFHMLLDGTSIAIGLYAAHAASWRADAKTHPFGYARYEVFGGFVNGILLLFIALYVTVESIQRILDPPEIEGPYLLLVSVVGLAVNIIGIVFFHDSHGHSHSHSHGEGGGGRVDHNMRGVYLHILADLMGSVSVIISSVVIYFFGLWIADPVCSALSAVLILLSAFPLLEETGKVLLLAAPDYHGNYCEELRELVLDTGLVQDVAPPKVWVHSTPPRELTVCTVAGKLRSNLDYSTSRKKLLDVITSHLRRNLDAHNVSVIVHLE